MAALNATQSFLYSLVFKVRAYFELIKGCGDRSSISNITMDTTPSALGLQHSGFQPNHSLKRAQVNHENTYKKKIVRAVCSQERFKII